MVQVFGRRLGVKLFVLLTAVIVLAMAPFSYVVFTTISQFGNHTADLNRKELKSRAHSYLASVSREQAHKYDAYFSHAETVASLMTAQAREVYNNLKYYAGFPPAGQGLSIQPEHGVGNVGRADVYTIVVGDRFDPARNGPEMQALLRLDPVFEAVRQEVPESVAIHLVTETGICRYVERTAPSPESPDRLRSDLVDCLGGGTKAAQQFTERSEAQEPATGWTAVRKDRFSGKQVLTAQSPVIDNAGVLRATIRIDIPLADRRGNLEQGAGNNENWTDEILFSFLLDGSGRIISFPRQYLQLFGLAATTEGEEGKVDGRVQSLSVSTIAGISAIMQKLLESDAETVEVRLNGTSYSLNMHSLHRLNWHLVVVAREAQLLSSVERTQQVLSGTLSLLAKKFMINGVLILVVMLVAVFFAVDYFVAPLKQLSESALQVGNGNLQVRCELRRSDELGILADSFNSMVSQLAAAETEQRNQSRRLEQTVHERTRDLRNKNLALNDVIGELNRESERRRRAVEALEKSEEQIRTLMEASLAGHGIIQDGRIRYGNSMASQVFGYSREEMTSGTFRVSQLMALHQYDRQGLLSHFIDDAGKPRLERCRRKDGTVFEALIGGAMISWEGSPAIAVTVMDISDRRQAEAELLQSKLLLQESLAEKEVLLREVYHRTKNNMLVIISLLHLQAMKVDDESVKTLFWETENRIRAMSLVHEKLYQSQNLAEIDLGQYLKEMVGGLVQSMVIDDRVRVEMDCAQVAVSLDSILPLGLAINEILTNSLKHAFPDRRTGRIFVGLHQDAAGLVEVVVSDDGCGLPPDMDPATARSLGMQITANLIERQLQGQMDVSSTGGVVYRIRFTERLRPNKEDEV